MAIKKTAEEQLVINYMNKLGLKAFKNNRQFWSHLEQRHDKEMIKKLDEAMKQRLEGKSTDEEIYNLKNSSLNLSLDVNKISADLYKKFFDWLANRKETSPKKILHVGCDNGLVTCFLASLYPQSEIVGVDLQPIAIECAEELASKLALPNISFLAMDINDLSDHFAENSFDLIVSLRSLDEAISLQGIPRYWSTKDLLEMSYLTERNTVFKSLSTLLKKESTSELISCERLAYMGEIALWSKMLTSNGFMIKWDQSEYLHFHELGEQQKMPIFIASTQNHGDLLEKVYQFESKGKILQLFEGKVLKEPEAEIVFQQTLNKELQIGVQINFSNGSGNMRIECWKTAEYVFLYEYTNIGYRKLTVFGGTSLSKALEQFEMEKEKWSLSGKVFVYENTKERDQLTREEETPFR